MGTLRSVLLLLLDFTPVKLKTMHAHDANDVQVKQCTNAVQQVIQQPPYVTGRQNKWMALDR